MVSSLLAAEAPKSLLSPAEGLNEWKGKREGLIARWEQALGVPTQSSHLEVHQSEVLEVFMTPEFKGTVLLVETGDFVRKPEDSPHPGHGHHEFGNAETYFLVGDALGKGMLKLLPK